MKRRTVWIAAGAIIVVGVGLALGLTLGRSNSKSQAASATPSTVEVARGDILKTLVVYGEVMPKQEYTFTFDGDRVESILVSEGERVTQGQTLVQLDSTSLQLALIQAERNLAEAKAGGVPADVKEKELAYQIALSNFDDATLTAPFAGVVSEVNQATTSSESWSLALIDTSELYIEADVDQLDAPEVAVGQSATAIIEPLPDTTWPVELVEVGGMAKSSGNSTVVVVSAKLPRADASILVGYTVEMEITTASATDVLIVPITCLNETPQGGYAVMKMMDGRPVPQAVTIGASSDSYVEIQSGLQEGDTLLDTSARSGTASSTSTQSQRNQFPGGGMVMGGFPGMP